MGKQSRKKLDISNKDFEFGYVRKPSWEGYDILKIMGDRIIARRKDNGLITVFFPVCLWEIDNLGALINSSTTVQLLDESKRIYDGKFQYSLYRD